MWVFKMDLFSFTPQYLTKNNRPWFPMMGEIHYSRYPEPFWKEAVLKMKAGGIDIISSYVIWIHHEEIEGEYDFSGSKNLRAFIETVQDCGLYFFIRIGPWCHGEVRNGGFPDWLLAKPFPLRTNDEVYFSAVEKWYKAIYAQVEGLFYRDGGPIIGIQIENEFGHCGGLGGEEGEYHMQRLTSLARHIGFDVPYWTATGWGGAVTGGLLPVMGGYCEAPWDQRLTDIEPSGNYIFTHERNDHNIGSDFRFGTGITFDLSKFPYLTAELGGGLQVTRHRRPVATARDIGAMTLVKLGSGVNLLGYYMYHGGTNPKGTLSSLQESRATGSINDLPELSYDFRAPIREYGQISDTYRKLKLFSYVIHDFGESLCAMPAIIPEDNPCHPADSNHIRYSWRIQNGSGYLFVNNYQRRQIQAQHRQVVFTSPVPVAQGRFVQFPPIDINNGDYFFLPLNMTIGNALLETALVTPLCIISGPHPQWIFYTAFSYAEELLIKSGPASLYQFKNDEWPSGCEIVTLTRREALNAWKIQNRLLVDENLLINEDRLIYRYIRRSGPPIFLEPSQDIPWPFYKSSCRYWNIHVPAWSGEDMFINIFWEGDAATLYEKGSPIADDFCTGAGHVWEIGLKRFGKGLEHDFILEIEPLYYNTPVYLESWPALEEGMVAKCIGITSELEYKEKL